MHPQKCTLQVLIHISRSWLTLDVNLTYVSADFLLHSGNILADGATENEKAYIDMLACVAMDFRNDFSKICYEPEMVSTMFCENNNYHATYVQESKKPAYLSKARKKLEDFSKNLGDKPWFAGNEASFGMRH